MTASHKPPIANDKHKLDYKPGLFYTLCLIAVLHFNLSACLILILLRRFSLVVGIITTVFTGSGCGKKAAESVKPEHTMALKLRVTGMQAAPTPYVCLRGQNIQGTPIEYYCQSPPDGEGIGHLESDFPANNHCELSVQFRGLTGTMSLPAGASVTAGVYLNNVLVKELFINSGNFASLPRTCTGAGAQQVCSVAKFADFVIP